MQKGVQMKQRFGLVVVIGLLLGTWFGVSPVAGQSSQCEDLSAYKDAVTELQRDDRAADFMRFHRDTMTMPFELYEGYVWDMDRDQGHKTIASMLWFLDELDKLDVPSVYEKGHLGMTTYVRYKANELDHLVFRSPNVPDPHVMRSAFDHLEEGETAAAESCASLIEDMGGYVLIDLRTQP